MKKLDSQKVHLNKYRFEGNVLRLHLLSYINFLKLTCYKFWMMLRKVLDFNCFGYIKCESNNS